MEDPQRNQSGRKLNVVSPALFIGLLTAGIILCGLSFFWDQAVIEWVKAHDLRTLKNVAGFLSKWGDWPQLMLFGGIGLALALWRRNRFLGKLLLCMMIAAS